MYIKLLLRKAEQLVRTLKTSVVGIYLYLYLSLSLYLYITRRTCPPMYIKSVG